MATWNSAFEAIPADSSSVSLGADAIRDLKVEISTRFNRDLYFDIAGTDADHGQHRKVTFQAPLGADPAPGSNKAALYTKNVSSRPELFWQNEDGTVLQLTLVAGLNSSDGTILDGDKVDIDWNATNYTPAIVAETADVDDLSSHLKGIDTAIGTLNTGKQGADAQICVMATGTYTGDGTASKAVTGVGFQPKFVRIAIKRTSANSTEVFEKSDQDSGLLSTTHQNDATTQHYAHNNRILSLDADGFTVKYGSGAEHPNATGIVYTYVAFGVV